MRRSWKVYVLTRRLTCSFIVIACSKKAPRSRAASDGSKSPSGMLNLEVSARWRRRDVQHHMISDFAGLSRSLFDDIHCSTDWIQSSIFDLSLWVHNFHVFACHLRNSGVSIQMNLSVDQCPLYIMWIECGTQDGALWHYICDSTFYWLPSW